MSAHTVSTCDDCGVADESVVPKIRFTYDKDKSRTEALVNVHQKGYVCVDNLRDELSRLRAEVDLAWTLAIEHAASVCEGRCTPDKNPAANNEGRKCALAIRQYVNRRSVVKDTVRAADVEAK